LETVVETAGGSGPWLPGRTFDYRRYAAFDLADGLQWLLCGPPRVGIPLLDECEQALANLRYRHTEPCTDGAAVRVPVAGWSGGDHPGCFEQGLSGWQVGQPLLHELFG
jgi:hypothetical protein